jgi:glutathione S-transferase
MLTIYGVYRSRASRNYWLANELNIAAKSVPVIQVYRLKDPNAADAPMHSRSAEFLKINPNGHVPAMDDDGFRLFESLAINLYIAKKHGGPLAPKDLAEDAAMTMWSLWAVAEVESFALQVMSNRATKPEVAQEAVGKLRAPFAVLDGALAATGTLVGGRFTVADINVAEVVRYAMAAPELFTAAPRVKAWIDACHARPAFKAMMAKREAEPA